jgi:hypothetical protein
VALKKDCSPCVAKICQQDPFCCTQTWDNVCVEQAEKNSCGCGGAGGAGGAGTGGAGGSGVAGTSGGAGAGATSGAGGGPPQQCLVCLVGNCGSQLSTCVNNAQCQQCLNNFTVGCLGNQAWQQLFNCTCSQCGPSCPEACGGPVPTPALPGASLVTSACAHDVCEAGEPLSPLCSPCVQKVCDQDAFCCDASWDDACIEQYQQLCPDDSCPGEQP